MILSLGLVAPPPIALFSMLIGIIICESTITDQDRQSSSIKDGKPKSVEEELPPTYDEVLYIKRKEDTLPSYDEAVNLQPSSIASDARSNLQMQQKIAC